MKLCVSIKYHATACNRHTGPLEDVFQSHDLPLLGMKMTRMYERRVPAGRDNFLDAHNGNVNNTIFFIILGCNSFKYIQILYFVYIYCFIFTFKAYLSM